MANIYDWTHVPPAVQWLATHDDGWTFGFESKPRMANGGWVKKAGEQIFSPSSLFSKIEKFKFKGDWRESLEQRPTDKAGES